MAYKRRMLGKSKCSKKPFTVSFLCSKKPVAVSLNSRKRKDVTTNSQVQKRLELLLQKRGKVGKSQQEGGFKGAIYLMPLLLCGYL